MFYTLLRNIATASKQEWQRTVGELKHKHWSTFCIWGDTIGKEVYAKLVAQCTVTVPLDSCLMPVILMPVMDACSKFMVRITGTLSTLRKMTTSSSEKLGCTRFCSACAQVLLISLKASEGAVPRISSLLQRKTCIVGWINHCGTVTGSWSTCYSTSLCLNFKDKRTKASFSYGTWGFSANMPNLHCSKLVLQH